MQLEIVGLRFKPAGKILQYVAQWVGTAPWGKVCG